MKEKNEDIIAIKLDKIAGLLQHILALELSRRGATQESIGKHLHVSKATVVTMLAGLNKEMNRERKSV